MSKRLKLVRWWGRKGGKVDRSWRTRSRNRAVRLEQLETRAMLFGVAPAIQPYLDPNLPFGLPHEGSNESLSDPVEEWQLNADLFDTEGGTFNLAWDLDGDTNFGEAGEPTLVNVTVPAWDFDNQQATTFTWSETIDWDTMIALGLDDTHPSFVDHEIFVRAIDVSDMQETIDETTIQVFDSMPFFGTVTVSQDGCGGGGDVTVAGSFREYGTNDTDTVRINWGDGTISTPAYETVNFLPAVTNNAAVNFSLQHTYASPGFYDITWEVWDDELGEFSVPDFPASMGAVVDFEVVTGGGSDQTVCLDDGVLTVNGSTGGDVVSISTSSGQVVVQANFPDSPFSFPAGDVQQIVVLLGDGDDAVTNGTTLPMVAVGGNGDDKLHDGGGLSILIGGDGADLLTGGGGQDILVDSGTAYDSNSTALLALLAEWNSGALLSTRISNILNGTGVPALNSSTITSDSDFDLLLGGGGIDWILLHSGDFAPGSVDQIANL